MSTEKIIKLIPKIKQGTVVKTAGKEYDIITATNERYHAFLPGKWRLKQDKVMHPITIGDQVLFHILKEGTGVIQKILPRKNIISRQANHAPHTSQLLAANIDQAFLVVSYLYPHTRVEFIDRILAYTHYWNIHTIIIFNKTDLLTAKEDQKMKSIIKIYQNLGYPTIAMHIFDQKKWTLLEKKSENKITLLIGHSGVGKSSIINAIAPTYKRATNHLNKKFHTGKHTTTHAAMLKIKKNSFLIDAPGIKNFILPTIPNYSDYFLEIKQYSLDCFYKNCQHKQEPKCAVRKAVQNKTIAYTRYQSYCHILAEKKESLQF